MGTLGNGVLDHPSLGCVSPHVNLAGFDNKDGVVRPAAARPARDAEWLRRCAWEIGEHRPADSFIPSVNHVGLAMAAPYLGFAHWRIQSPWIDKTAWLRGQSWHNCRMILRLYDVSYLQFTGFNANAIQDEPLPATCGNLFFKLSRPGTWQLAEVGFLLRSGEFIPAARSRVVAFPPDTASSHHSQEALFVQEGGQVEPIGNLWDQERILRERRRPRLRQPLRIAAFAFASGATGQVGGPAQFVSELAAGQSAQGHEVHVFAPASQGFSSYRQVAGVHYHALEVDVEESPMQAAEAFSQAAETRLREFPRFDLLHLHEWRTGLLLGLSQNDMPAVLSLSSIEATRRNGTPPSAVSLAIEESEREVVQVAPCVLTTPWLREKAVKELNLDAGRVVAFPMEGRMPCEWELPLDFGQVKMEIGLGPLDRLLLFIGPLEHAAGADLLLDALPVLLGRWPNVRLAYAGEGNLHGQLKDQLHRRGLAYAVRLLGHVEGPKVARLLRSAAALVLPSRYRVPQDDAVVDLARRAGRPVVTTHGGPCHLVRHEETGIITYDNPGSMVWAIDRILGDADHAERMGAAGRRQDDATVVWSEVARHYLELCAAYFPQLRERPVTNDSPV